MTEHLIKTGERVHPHQIKSVEEYLSYLRHKFAYELADKFLPDGHRSLEIGSGEGYGTSLLSIRSSKMIGLDIDQPTINHADQKYGTEKCQFQIFDGTRLPFESESFDSVVTFQVIEHIVDDNAFLVEISRVLKTGGWLIVTTPNRIYRLKPGQKPWNRFHIREYYPDEFEQLMSKHYTSVKVSGIIGVGDVQTIELASVKKGFYDLDKFNIRHLIPQSIRPALASFARSITGRKLDSSNLKNSFKTYSTSDYLLTENDRDSSLDLFGLAQKK